MNLTNFFAELKRHNVLRAAAFYAASAWLLVQVATQVFPFFHIAEWVVRWIVVAACIGFPFAMVFSWFYEWTPHGLQRESDIPPNESVTRQTGQKLDRWIIAILGMAVVLLLANQFVLHHDDNKPADAASFATPTLGSKSIAVLPFENLSRDPDNAYFATGIQDEILTRLAKIGALKVISRTSTQQYAARPGNLSEIARQLNVANVLEGSVQRVGDQVHISAQLIRAATGEHLWAESYDRKLENIFGVEAEVATAVAEALRAKLTATEQHSLAEKLTNNPQAYDAYLRGIALWRQPSMSRYEAIKAFEQAVRLDPNFAAAWAQLAQSNSLEYFNWDETPARRAAAQMSLDAALGLQPNLDEVQLAQAFYQYRVLRDFKGARESFERLRKTCPNNADVLEGLGLINTRLGRLNEGRILFDEAVALNPRDRIMRADAAWIRESTGDLPAALHSYDEALKIWPGDANFTAGKAGVYQALGDLDHADALLKGLHPKAEDSWAVNVIYYQAVLRRQYPGAIDFLRTSLNQTELSRAMTRIEFRQKLADLQRLSGDIGAANTNYSQARDELEQMLKEQPENDGLIMALADVYAGLGDREQALTLANRAVSLVSKDAPEAPRREEARARIAARFGLNDLAIPVLERLLHTSYNSSITPALLRLDPDFDPLRGDPRFDELAWQTEPKTSK